MDPGVHKVRKCGKGRPQGVKKLLAKIFRMCIYKKGASHLARRSRNVLALLIPLIYVQEENNVHMGRYQ